jgi:acyl-CoA synthetase (AMP-forming)/AMP-acid ligase II
MEVEPLPQWPSIGRMFADNAARFAGAPALIDGEIELSYSVLLDAARAAAKSLLAAGVSRGDLVALWAPNSWRWAVTAHAVWLVGGVIVPISSRLKLLEAGPILERTGAKILFTVAECASVRFIDSLHEAYGADLAGLPALKHLVRLDLDGSFDDFLGYGAAIDDAALARATDQVSGEDVCEIVFTSGTTGAPKGVQLSHHQLMRSYWTWSGIGGLKFGDKYLVITPFSHGFGLNAGIIASALRGMCMIVLDFFEPERTLSLIRRHGINVMGGPPNLFARLMDLPEVAANPPTSLRVAFLGAASVPMEVLRRCRSVLGIERVINAYGLMEACVVSMTRADDLPDVIAGTTGRALPDVEVRVVDAAGADMAPGAAGEILVRSYGIMKGYWRDPAQTAASLTPDSWFHTGDIGVTDVDGNITIVDRKKDMFICGGFNAYPAEIENLLLKIDGLSAVSVVAVPDTLRGEVPVAFVVPAANSGVGPDTVLTWAKRNIASYKVPRQVHVVSALPLNANGKVMKDVLRQRAIGAEGRAAS